MTLAEAIIELHRLTGKSQQVFATELRITIRSLQLYEQGRRLPEPKTLLALAAYADALNNDDLYSIFLGDAFMSQLCPPPGYEVEIKFHRSPALAKKSGRKR